MGAPEDNTVPELLYHTCLFVNETIAEAVFTQHHVYVIRTHSTLQAAKDFARRALEGLGYDNTDFEVLEIRAPSTKEWNHPDGVVAYGKVPAGLEFIVSIDTKANAEKLRATPDGVLVLPPGVDHLHYVLQTTTDYSKDQHSVTDIQGAYVKRADAIEAARNCLIGEDITGRDYAQYDVRDGGSCTGGLAVWGRRVRSRRGANWRELSGRGKGAADGSTETLEGTSTASTKG